MKLNTNAMEKVARGRAAQYADAFRHIHKMVTDTEASHGELTISFDDGSAEDGDFMPELVLRVKMVGPTE